MVKYYELKRGDKAQHGPELLTFQKVDWMYTQWKNEKGELRIGHSMDYELKDWIYYPVTPEEDGDKIND